MPPSTSRERPPDDLAPVLLVTGKGGVGKTTVAASLALVEAQSRGAATLVEFGDGDAGRRALTGSRGLVEHVVIRPDAALARGATPLFGSATLARLALGNFAMKPLLKAAPAVRELAMLESVRQLASERPGRRIVVDLPATGHSVAWLRVPRQGKDFLGEGPLYELCDRVALELLAPGRSSIVVVTLPEVLVLEETLELCAAIEREAGLAVARLVVNRVPVALPVGALGDARAGAARGGPLAAAFESLAEILAGRTAARAAAHEALASLSGQAIPAWQLPLAPSDPDATDVAAWLREAGAP